MERTDQLQTDKYFRDVMQQSRELVLYIEYKFVMGTLINLLLLLQLDGIDVFCGVC